MTTPRNLDSGLYRYRFGTAELDQAQFALRVAGEIIEVQRKPLEVLLELLIHAGQVVTREQLLQSVWQGRPSVDNVVGNAVKKLRMALGEANAALIETEHGVGYRFSGQIERMAVGRSHDGHPGVSPGSPVPARPEMILERSLSRSNRSEVWLARDTRTGEPRVFKFSVDAPGLDALKREVTAWQLLGAHYPNALEFVNVLAFNFASAPFYLECEYAGRNLAEWAAAEGALTALTDEQRLAIFLAVADAVAAAHDVGVLHTDLKPTNVLVAESAAAGEGIKLTDFGSSRLLDRQRLEALGITPLGFTINSLDESSDATPFYMAPELVAGHTPTIRSDIYALGILLYQLLGGSVERPFTSGWERDIADGLIRDDILRATDVDPERRFASVKEFTSHLRALQQRKDNARRSEQALQAAQMAQQELQRIRARRPWIVATIAVLLMAATALGALAIRLDAAKRIATNETDRAQAVNDLLLDLFRNANPEQGKGYDITLAQALARVAPGLHQRFANAPLTEEAVHRTAADLYASLADFRAAIDHLKRSVELLRAARGGDDAQTIETRYLLARAQSQAADFAGAKQTLDAADQALARNPQDENRRLLLAAATARGKYFLFQMKMPQAESYLAHAQQLQLALDPANGRSLLQIRVDLAQVYNQSSRPEKAIELLQNLDSPLYSQRTVGAALHAKATSVYGSALTFAGRSVEAQPQLEAALRAMETIYGPDSTQAAEQHAGLAVVLNNRDDLAGSLQHTAIARRIFCAKHGEHHPGCLQQYANEGIMSVQSGNFAAATSSLRAAYIGYERLKFTIDSPALQVFSYYLAVARLELGDVQTAATLAAPLHADALNSASPGEGWEERIRALRGAILIAQGRRVEGIALLRPAVTTLEAGHAQQWIVQPLRKRLDAAQRGL